MNAISTFKTAGAGKTAWERPTLRRFRPTDEQKTELLAQSESRRGAAGEQR